jgi:glucan phosphoethanolaminetransferase (alkaline phosphatase superfamily)
MEKIRQREIRFVLECVRILFENYDADTAVISADHAESLGENEIWGHPYGYPFGSIRRVPYVETEAIDKEIYQSQYESQTKDPNEHDEKEFLQNMGYL